MLGKGCAHGFLADLVRVDYFFEQAGQVDQLKVNAIIIRVQLHRAAVRRVRFCLALALAWWCVFAVCWRKPWVLIRRTLKGLIARHCPPGRIGGQLALLQPEQCNRPQCGLVCAAEKCEMSNFLFADIFWCDPQVGFCAVDEVRE